MDRAGCGLLVILAIIRSVGAASYAGLFVFGDSYVDTGNHEKNMIEQNEAWRPPYGITWPGYPTGRFSDGRVFTDFYASFLNLTNPIPYRVIKSTLNSTSDKANLLSSFGATGINFGFGGSGVGPTYGPNFPTINNQINELTQLLGEGVVSREMLMSSLVLLVVAGNDYTTFLQNNSATELPLFIPTVVARIGDSLAQLYDLGFKNLAVTNLEPVGCLPYITSSMNYTACNETANFELSITHNFLLAATISTLQIRYLNAKFVLLDFYMAFKAIVQGAKFPLRPCCEGVNGSSCGHVDSNGSPLYKLCSSPQEFLYWDNTHPTDAGWKAVSKALQSTL